MGTPALSEYNIRMLLGPRVFLARLGEFRHTSVVPHNPRSISIS